MNPLPTKIIVKDNILPAIDEILKKHRLTPKKDVRDFLSSALLERKYAYTTPCRDDTGEEVIFKFLISDEVEFRSALIEEINSMKALAACKFENFRTPALIDFRVGEQIWYLRHSARGDIVGDPFILRDDLGSKIIGYADKISSILLELANIGYEKDRFDNFDFGYSTPRDYLKAIKENGLTIAKYLPDFIEKSEDLFSAYDFPSREELVLCHGDCHLGNFIFDKGSATLIDWGAHWGNVAEDYAKIWTSLWQYPEAQARLSRSFSRALPPQQQKIFVACLPQMLLYQAANKASWMYMAAEGKVLGDNYRPETIKQAIKYFSELILMLLSQKSPAIVLDESQ